MDKIKQIRESKEYSIELIKGNSKLNKPIYAFILIQKSFLKLFRDNLISRERKISDFGVILATGEGHDPSPEVFEEVKKKIQN